MAYIYPIIMALYPFFHLSRFVPKKTIGPALPEKVDQASQSCVQTEPDELGGSVSISIPPSYDGWLVIFC